MYAKNRVRSSNNQSGGEKVFKGGKDVFLDQKETEEVIGKNEGEEGVNCKWLERRKQKSDGR